MGSGSDLAVHLPAMAREALEVLMPERGGVYVDATVGPGGHSEAILARLGQGGTLIGIDRDEEALKAARARTKDERFMLRHARFSELEEVVREAGFEKVSGVLMDLGVSMLQMKGMERGFSFSSDAPLDMRMDQSQGVTAGEIVNTYPEGELERVIREYGEEWQARRIARAISQARRRKPVATCKELAELIARVAPYRGRIHPATRTFQALRIEANRELEELDRGLRAALNMLAADGRLAVISYHSLEDRAVKNFMREAAREGRLRLLTKKPLRPSDEETRENPSARSARLRAGEKI